MAAAKAKLAEVLAVSEAALVDREAEAQAKGCSKRLGRMFSKRAVALERLNAALAVLVTTADESLLDWGAEELKLAIEACKKAQVDEATIGSAQRTLHKAYAGAMLAAEMRTVAAALGNVERHKNPDARCVTQIPQPCAGSFCSFSPAPALLTARART